LATPHRSPYDTVFLGKVNHERRTEEIESRSSVPQAREKGQEEQGLQGQQGRQVDVSQ